MNQNPKKAIEEKTETYTIPLLGVHARHEDMVIQIIPTHYTKSYAQPVFHPDGTASLGQQIDRQDVYLRLVYAAAFHARKQEEASFTADHPSYPLGTQTHTCALQVDDLIGKPAVGVWINIDPLEAVENAELWFLVDTYGTYSFHLGYVPFSAENFHLVWHAYKDAFRAGVIAGFPPFKDKHRIKIDFPYCRDIVKSSTGLYLFEEETVIPEEEEERESTADLLLE